MPTDSASTDTLDLTAAGDVTRITLNRPHVLNALNSAMVKDLTGLLPQLDSDPDVRCIVVTGAGRGFCAGADVADLAAAASGDATLPPANRQLMRHGSVRLAKAFMNLETPLIAAVNGPCAGAGFGIALAADFLVARSDASFSVAFVRRGLVPDYATTFLLPRIAGLKVARELCLLGDNIPADDQRATSFVHQVVAPEEFDDAVVSLAARLAGGAGVALGLTKRLLGSSFEVDHAMALDREFTAQALCFSSADAVEGATAFLEKREPVFGGS